MDNIVVVLDHPQNVVNIAGVIRVMMNFGLSRLRLVNPDDFDAYRIEGIAHRSAPLIEATTIHDSLADALADATYIVGTTARPRTAGRNYTRPRDVGRSVAREASDGTVAVLFGREDRGLANDALDLCHEVSIIPTDADYSSLNLFQACLVHAYEIFLTVGEYQEEFPKGRRATRAPTQEELEQTFAALEAGLGRIEFFKARKPEAVMRTLRTIIARAQPDLRESKLLAAVGYEIGHYMDRKVDGPESPDPSEDQAAGDP